MALALLAWRKNVMHTPWRQMSFQVCDHLAKGRCESDFMQVTQDNSYHYLFE
jgi:hypothetical protein